MVDVMEMAWVNSGESWMEPLIDHLQDEILPQDPKDTDWDMKRFE